MRESAASRSRSTLRELYRRVPSSSSTTTGSNRGSSVRVRESLSNRYSRRLDSDLERLGPRRVDTPRPRPSGPSGRTEPRRGAGPEGSPRRTGERTARPPSSAAHRYAGRNSTPTRVARPTDRPRTIERRVSGVASGPRLGPTRRTISPTLSSANRRLYTPRTSYYSPRRYYRGYLGWQNHYNSLAFSFGYCPPGFRWGLYSYPFYFGARWPSFYWGYRRNFGFFWNSNYAWCGPANYWPATYYCPTVYVSHRYVDDGFGYDYVDDFTTTSYYGGSSVTVLESDSAGSGDETISAGDPLTPRAASPSSLAEHHVALGDFYFREERFQEAAESYLRALAYAPDDAAIHFVLADALFAIGDYHYAAFMIGKGLRLDPELATAEADKREFYENVERFEEHVATLRRYTTDKPYDAAAHLVLGYNLRFSVQPEEAQKVFQRVLEIDPANESAQLFLEALRAPPKAAAPVKKIATAF